MPLTADADIARLLSLRAGDAVLQITRVLAFAGVATILEDIWLPATPFKGLTAERLSEYDGPMYALFETEFGVRMVRAEEKIKLNDLNQGQRRDFNLPAQVLLSYFDPDGLGHMPATAARFKRAVPFMWVIGTRDPLYPSGEGFAYALALPHPQSSYLVVQADRRAAIADAIAQGVARTGVRVESINCEFTPTEGAPRKVRSDRAAAAPLDEARAELLALVRRARAGKPDAQAELVQRYSRRLGGFVRGIIRQPDAVEDVTQMVFIKMFRRLSRLRDPAVFESWLFTLARNTALDFIRRRKCRPLTVGLDDQVNRIADPRNETAVPEILAALDRALLRLNSLDRSLVSQFVRGDSYGEIARRAGISLASVKVRLHRVRPFLRTTVGGLTGTRAPDASGWRPANRPVALAA